MRWTAWTAGITCVWLGTLSAFAASGFVREAPMPRLFYLLGASNIAPIILAFSPLGTRLSYLPLPALVGFQIFRLPLELVLHRWALDGTIPTTMTWSGANYDIVSGIAALFVAPIATRVPGAARLFNIIGLVLLLNVARVAILSSPFPFGWGVSPPLELGLQSYTQGTCLMSESMDCSLAVSFAQLEDTRLDRTKKYPPGRYDGFPSALEQEVWGWRAGPKLGDYITCWFLRRLFRTSPLPLALSTIQVYG